MLQAFQILINALHYGGGYHSLTPGGEQFIDQDQYQSLVDEHIMFKNMDKNAYLSATGIAADRPHGRGFHIPQHRGFSIWIGEEDHLRIMCMARGTILNFVFDRLETALYQSLSLLQAEEKKMELEIS